MERAGLGAAQRGEGGVGDPAAELHGGGYGLRARQLPDGRALAEVQVQLGELGQDLLLQHAPAGHRLHGGVAHRAGHRVAQQPHPGLLVGVLDRLGGGRAALRLVAVEQGLVGPADHGGELPAEVVAVLDTGVEALAAGRAVGVGGVARDEHRAGAEARRDLGVHLEPVGPPGLAEGQPAGPALVQQPLEQRVGRRLAQPVRRQVEEDPVAALRQRHQDQHALGGDVVLRLVGRGGPGQRAVAEQEHPVVGVALEGDADRLAEHAVGAVGGHHPAERQAFGGTAGAAQGDRDRGVGPLVRLGEDQAERLGPPLHGAAEFGEPLVQRRLGDGLRDAERVGEGGVGQAPEAHRADLLLLGPVRGPDERQRGVQQGVGDTQPVQALQRAAPQDECLGRLARTLAAVDHPAGHSVAEQCDGGGQPGGAGADDQDSGHAVPPSVASASAASTSRTVSSVSVNCTERMPSSTAASQFSSVSSTNSSCPGRAPRRSSRIW